jgi:hypothetical protein
MHEACWLALPAWRMRAAVYWLALDPSPAGLAARGGAAEAATAARAPPSAAAAGATRRAAGATRAGRAAGRATGGGASWPPGLRLVVVERDCQRCSLRGAVPLFCCCVGCTAKHGVQFLTHGLSWCTKCELNSKLGTSVALATSDVAQNGQSYGHVPSIVETLRCWALAGPIPATNATYLEDKAQQLHGSCMEWLWVSEAHNPSPQFRQHIDWQANSKLPVTDLSTHPTCLRALCLSVHGVPAAGGKHLGMLLIAMLHALHGPRQANHEPEKALQHSPHQEVYLVPLLRVIPAVSKFWEAQTTCEPRCKQRHVTWQTEKLLFAWVGSKMVGLDPISWQLVAFAFITRAFIQAWLYAGKGVGGTPAPDGADSHLKASHVDRPCHDQMPFRIPRV